MIDVVIALILNESNHVLITQRPLNKPLGGVWEFPGGKVEPGEHKEAALCREIKEEVGLEILSCEWFDEILREDKNLTLSVYWVKSWFGHATCLEGQLGLAWVDLSRLGEYLFPETNQALVEHLQSLTLTAN